MMAVVKQIHRLSKPQIPIKTPANSRHAVPAM
jgi:hypothetical protein